MSNARPINSNSISPTLVLQNVAEDLENIEQIFIVAISKDRHPISWSSGTLGGLSIAALCLQDLALRELRGGISDD